MVTAVGIDSDLEILLGDLIQLDYDAAAAYQAAIDRIEDISYREVLTEFRLDHLRHTRDLGELLATIGKPPPTDADVKGMVTQGKVLIGGLLGDKAILQAIKTNEEDTNAAYERAVQHRDASERVRAALQRGLTDERRHREWIVNAVGRL